MKPRIHLLSLLLGVALGGIVTFLITLAGLQSGETECWLHVKNTGTRPVQIQALGGRLPIRTTLHFGFLPFPERKEHWGRQLSPGELGSVPYAPGCTLHVMEMRGVSGVLHPFWTGVARTLVGQINADDFSNIVFQVTSESP